MSPFLTRDVGKPNYYERLPTLEAREQKFHVQICLPNGFHTLVTLINSGAYDNIIDENLVRQLGIDLVLPCLIQDSALDGHIVGSITHQTAPLQIIIW